jgi:hypothetical protein
MSYLVNSVGEEQWNDLIGSFHMLAGGVNAPASTPLPGLPTLDCYGFAGTGTKVNELSTSFELTHDYKEESDLSVHIHWAGTTSGAGNVKWYFDYTILDATGNEAPALTTVSGVAANPGLGANGRPIMKITPTSINIPGTGLKIGSVLILTVRRDPTDVADTYTGIALALSIGIHYQVDSLGSRHIATK